MMMHKYLGIDESNYGRFPEIYAGVSSSNFDSIVEKWGLSKRRKNRSIEKILGRGHDYRHILVERTLKEAFGEMGVKAIVLSEFIRHFKALEYVLVDGNLDETILDLIDKIVYPLKAPKITGFPNGDRRFPLINQAHHTAYNLFKYYTVPGKAEADKKKHLQNRITIVVENYAGGF